MVSRRSFIVTGSALVIAGSASTGSGARVISGLSSAAQGKSDNLNSDFFKRHLMSDFQVEGISANSRKTLRLIEVKNSSFANDPAGVQREGFSLLFQGSEEGSLPQDNYRFRNPSFGSHNMFTVPVTSEKGIYEVAFNRLKA